VLQRAWMHLANIEQGSNVDVAGRRLALSAIVTHKE
jgi:hypothetical protein